MTKNNKKPPIALPLLLGFAGIAALATSMALIKPLVNEQTSHLVKKMKVRKSPSTSSSMMHANAEPVALTSPPNIPTAKKPPVEAQKQPEEESPSEEPLANEISSTGPWTITLSSKYKTDEAGDAAIASIVDTLKSNPDINIALLGLNNPKKSSKRAKAGVNKIKDRILKLAQVNKQRITLSSEQKPGIQGIIVNAQIKGGKK